MAEFERVASADEMETGERKSIIVNDYPALLFRIDDQYYAIEDVCTHDGQPLTAGYLNGKAITCPRHGARFDITNGNALCMPATEAVRTFEVEVRDGEVFVKVDS